MKAEILEQIITDGNLGFIHGMFYKIRRLWCKDAKVIITTENNNIYVHNKPFGDYTKVGEIEVSDKLVNDALTLLNAKNAIKKHLKTIQKLTKVTDTFIAVDDSVNKKDW